MKFMPMSTLSEVESNIVLYLYLLYLNEKKKPISEPARPQILFYFLINGKNTGLLLCEW